MKKNYPSLSYCKENVCAIYKLYEKMYKLGSVTNPELKICALETKYPLLQTRQNALSRVRSDLEGEGWKQMKEDLFRELIRALADHNLLDVKDDRLLIAGIEGHFYHALNLFLNGENKNLRKEELLPLTGLYRLYQPSAELENMVMIGNCWVEYIENGNYLVTRMEQDYTPNGGNKRENRFHGTIVPMDGNKCFWIDKDRNRNLQRIMKLLILQRRTLSDDTEEVLALNGWCRYESEGLELARRVFLERASQPIIPEYYPKEHDLIPHKLRPFLIRNSDNVRNVMELEPIRFQV